MAGLRALLARPRWILTIGALTFIALVALIYKGRGHDEQGQLAFPLAGGSYATSISSKDFVKPSGVKVVALVFYGRKNRVEMLRCYLERNLVDNGGWLDEVHWVLNTGKEDDLEYLEEILASEPRYKKIDLSDEGIGFEGYGHAWGHLERDCYYVKIDDDVVFMADDAIPRVVSLKLQHPKYLVTSANMINSPLMGWVHYRTGAMHPYLPEFDRWEPPILSFGKRVSWKWDAYPKWTGPDDYYFDWTQDSPYKGHRWLRLPDDTDIYRTPVAQIEYATWGTGVLSWGIAAQEHYSFLENLATENLDAYKLHKTWITDYKRLSINFICVYSNEVLDNLPMDTVDEEWLTVNLPKKLGKSVAVETDALAVHFTFGGQGVVQETDLLLRYRDYAMQNACRRKVDLNAGSTS
ncbi:uncharacterized protein HMPREF1541_00225 [Cyphellophora europaea CBS 101466]|uniref:Uncharacterized protein n=1 Tax=Cyphellophora europaea (strain CBS 101466) TaxID=1220924 RepID=W2SBG4_CYPE1|nr:uncharacterized protein HMPREF1541_00225 [Cyphellophora europaea CBS 101466]ETN46042.1 hypothetical protein HMPREF1541_00225 [Cyphellophora europaea CBS 101466]